MDWTYLISDPHLAHRTCCERAPLSGDVSPKRFLPWRPGQAFESGGIDR